MKRFTCAATCLSLSSLIGLTATASAGWASTAETRIGTQETSAHEISTSEISAKEQGNGDLQQGVPGRRVGGGTRGEQIFASATASLAALVTANNLSVTTATYPTLLFYVPEMVSTNRVEFVLRDSRDELIYETTYQLGREGGLVSVETVGAILPLTLNEDYQWYFSVVPDADDRANDVVVEGRIRRVEQSAWLAQQQVATTVLAQLAIAPPLRKARLLYQQANLWHDAALILDDLRQHEPDNPAVAAEWDQLLESVDLLPFLEDHPAPIQVGSN